MPNDKLGPFKAGDLQKKTPPKPVKPKQGTPTEEAEPTTLGFARIESIVESDDPEKIRAELHGIIKELKAFGATAKAAKDRQAAQKATVAVERTLDLLNYLFQTKEALIEAAKEQG